MSEAVAGSTATGLQGSSASNPEGSQEDTEQAREQVTEQGSSASKKVSVRLGTVLGGKYRLTRRLGDGAMGAVFAAQHERLGREVAVKILRSDLSSHLESAARFQREAELVTRIGHPNIVAVYDFGQAEGGGLYYVMELIGGRTLRARLEEGPLGDDEIVNVFSPLLSAVQVAHGVGVVHRDLKPDEARASAT